ncbi:MAG: preprotein translocase subunit YajC [Proteobacteria bacterium]|nr:preprotein translocase subunit YajC [Pseudomonadota bacterium]
MFLPHLISPAYAQSGGEGGSIFGALLPFILIFVVFYFLLIRPQQKRARLHQEMVAALKKGDYVVTAGGINGRVTKAAEGSDSVDVEIASGVVVNVMRGSISQRRDTAPKPTSKPPRK